MKTRKLFYLDPKNEVIVTDSAITIRNKRYLLQRIRHFGIKILKPILLPGLTFVITGSFLIITGLLKKVVFDFIPYVSISGFTIDGAMWAILTGLCILVAGVYMMSSRLEPRYALHITTEDEDNDVIVSDQREYVRQIMEAIDKAIGVRSPQANLERLF